MPFRYSETVRLNFSATAYSPSSSTITSDEDEAIVALTTVVLLITFSSIKRVSSVEGEGSVST